MAPHAYLSRFKTASYFHGDNPECNRIISRDKHRHLLSVAPSEASHLILPDSPPDILTSPATAPPCVCVALTYHKVSRLYLHINMQLYPSPALSLSLSCHCHIDAKCQFSTIQSADPLSQSHPPTRLSLSLATAKINHRPQRKHVSNENAFIEIKYTQAHTDSLIQNKLCIT